MTNRACYLLTWYFLSASWPLDDLWTLPHAGYVYTTSGLTRIYHTFKPAPKAPASCYPPCKPNTSLQFLQGLDGEQDE